MIARSGTSAQIMGFRASWAEDAGPANRLMAENAARDMAATESAAGHKSDFCMGRFLSLETWVFCG